MCMRRVRIKGCESREFSMNLVANDASTIVRSTAQPEYAKKRKINAVKRNFRWLRTARENFSVLGSGADPLFLNPLRNATRFPFRSVRWRFTYVRAYVLSTVSSFYHFFMDVLHLLSLVSNGRTRDDLMIRVRTNMNENVCVCEREKQRERINGASG